MTESQEDLKNKLEDTAILLQEVVTDPVVLEEIGLAIQYNTETLNRDERVDFKELFSDNSPYKTVLKQRATSQNISGAFAKKFREKAESLKKWKAGFTSQTDWESFLQENDITIYWPYSEYWDGKLHTPTLVSDPIDNEHRNEGFRPSNDQNSKSEEEGSTTAWDRVLVDDQYAQENQTLIIKPNYTAPACCGDTGETAAVNSTSSSDNIFEVDVEEDQNTTAQVYLGYVQMKNQLDGLFKGGPDLRFIFIDVVEIEPGVVEAQRIYRRKDFSRGDVSNDRWKRLYTLVDHRWHSYQKTLPFHVYDLDGDGSTTVTLSSTLESTSGTNVEIESTYKVADKRDEIGKIFFDREVFLNQNETGGFHGKKDGYRVYKIDRGFFFTVPHEIINLN